MFGKKRKMILVGEEVTAYYQEGKTIEGVGIVQEVHQLLFDDKYALVTMEFQTGILKGQEGDRIIKI